MERKETAERLRRKLFLVKWKMGKHPKFTLNAPPHRNPELGLAGMYLNGHRRPHTGVSISGHPPSKTTQLPTQTAFKLALTLILRGREQWSRSGSSDITPTTAPTVPLNLALLADAKFRYAVTKGETMR